uniref:PA domain-containing protein n=1 Tax=Anopheles funestus TaxID=62324 RepID=A0A1Y9HBI2_ANOFN
MMSALSHQVNMNNFLSLLVGASLVAANSSPSHDIASLSQPTEFSNGVSSFALPAEERMAIESFVMAYLNYSYTGSDGHLVELGGNESAKYGEGRVLNRSGILVHISNSVNRSDHTGCYKHWSGTLGESIPDRSTPWIALVRRGGCNFEDKVKHAYEHGAAGVIIYNDKGDSKLDKMKINDKERNITAVFTSKAMGLELIEILEVHKYDVHMRIIEGSHQFHPLGNINRTSVLFVSISFIVLMIISLVWLVFYYVQRFRYLQTKDKQSFTGSQESILQLDMDMEEGDLIDDRSSTDGGYQRRNSVSPLPQIRASNENQMSRSSSDSDSEQDHEDCVTPQSSGRRSSQGRNKRDSQRQHEKSQQDGDICVGCLAAALNKKQKNNDNAQEDGESDSYATEENGSKSLPATLKKYKGNHSTGSCRGMNPPDHYHPYPYNDKHGSRVYQNQQPQNSAPEEHSSQQSSNLPFKFYKTESGQPRKVRTPLRNLIPQSISAPCDTDSSLRVCIHGGIEQHFSEATTSKTGTLHANVESEELPAVHISQRPIDAKRRCSLSRNSSCSSADRKDVVTCEDLKIAIDYSNEEDVSDETEPNSDNDLIIRRSERGDEKETRKK